MTSAWKVNRGPVLATDIDIEKAQAIGVLLVRPIGILPSGPGDHIRPFEIGLFEEMRALLKPDVAPTKLRRAVAAYAHTKRYYFASAQPGSVRHDIEGNPTEALSEVDRLTAQDRFLELRKKTDKVRVAVNEPSAAATITKAEKIRTALLGATNRHRQS